MTKNQMIAEIAKVEPVDPEYISWLKTQSKACVEDGYLEFYHRGLFPAKVYEKENNIFTTT